MDAKKWVTQKIGEWVFFGLLGLGWATVLAWLKLDHSALAAPLLYGSAGACMVWVAGSLYIAISRIPRLRTRVTVDNIEHNVRAWLDRSGCSVKSDPAPETFFRLSVQSPGGCILSIGRPRSGLIEHVLIHAPIANEKTGLRELQDAPKEEQARLLELVKVELARARVGYFGLAIPLNQQFSVGKSVRITDSLDEEEFNRALWDVEAAVNAVIAVYRLWVQEINKVQARTGLMPPSASQATPSDPTSDL